MPVVLAKNIQTQKIEFSAPKALSNGSRTVYINYMNEKLLLQTPLMSIPYGVGDYNNQKDPKTGELPAIKKYDLNVSFRGMESNPALKNLHDKMQEVEARIKEECFKNRLLWLRDDYDGLKAATDRLFFPVVKYDKDKDTGKVVGKYPPTLKVKLPYDNNTDNFTFECKDMDGNDLNFLENMKNLKGAKARLIIQLGGLWFVGGRYGCTWKVVKAHFQLRNSRTDADFVKDEDDVGTTALDQSDEDEDEDVIVPSTSQKTKNTTLVEESDDEEEEDATQEEEEEEDIPPPPPPAPKKATSTARRRAPSPEPDEDDDVDSELEEELPPPPPKRSAAAKKTVKK